MQATDPRPTPDQHATPIADWLRLEQADGVGRRSVYALLAVFGTPGAILRAGPQALSAHVTPAQARAICAPVTPALAALIDATLAWLAAPDHHFVTCHDPRYPPALAEIPDPPLLLYVSGRVELLAQPLVAVVGAAMLACRAG